MNSFFSRFNKMFIMLGFSSGLPNKITVKPYYTDKNEIVLMITYDRLLYELLVIFIFKNTFLHIWQPILSSLLLLMCVIVLYYCRDNA